MYYELTVAISNSNTFLAIVKNLHTQDSGILKATKIAKFDCFCNSKPVYKHCDPVEIIIGGPFILEEYKGKIPE